MTNTLFNFSNTIISVESNSPPILKEVKNLFLPFYIEGNRSPDIEYILEVSGEPRIEGEFYGKVYQKLPSPALTPTLSQRERGRGARGEGRGEGVLYETKDPFEYISFIEWSIIDTAIEKMEGYYQIHGGAAVKDNKGIILPAPPGSGKTTLTVGLAMNGFQCLSDDIVLIDAASLRLNPFPRNIFITDEKIAVFERYGYSLPLRKSDWADMGGWDFIFNPPPIEGFSAVDFIVFPKYNPSQKTELNRISKGKAIFEIVKESFNIHKFRDRGIDIVHRLVENAECYQLTVNDLNEAVKIISDLLATEGTENTEGKKD